MRTTCVTYILVCLFVFCLFTFRLFTFCLFVFHLATCLWMSAALYEEPPEESQLGLTVDWLQYYQNDGEFTMALIHHMESLEVERLVKHLKACKR